MTTTTRNEAAEHFHRFLQTGQPWPKDMVCECGQSLAAERLSNEGKRLMFWQPKDDTEAADDFGRSVREALAAERRATVERIRERLEAGPGTPIQTAYLLQILDEEAAR